MATCTACDATATTTCTKCGTALCTLHVHQGQPFISARQLVATTASTAVRTPALLGDILFKELDQVPYCAECREDLAARRTTEQLKFLLGMLLIVAVVVGVPMYLLLFS